jgi:hypothetical protein
MIDLCNKLGLQYFVGNRYTTVTKFEGILEISLNNHWLFIGWFEYE